MKCQQVEIRFSAFVEGELGAKEACEVEAHLASCAVCAAALEHFRSALALLRGRGRAETSEHVAKVILAGVDAVAREEVSSAENVFERAMLTSDVHARYRRRTGRSVWLSHAAALLAGAAAVFLIALFYWKRAATELEFTASQLALQFPETRTVRAEPKPDPVETPDPIPREDSPPAGRPLIIERIVEVSRPVETVIQRGPLVELDFARLASAIERAATSLQLLAARQEVPESEMRSAEPMFQPSVARTVSLDGDTVSDPLASRRRAGASASVIVEEGAGQVIVNVNGLTAEVIPALIGELEQARGARAEALGRCLAEIYREVRELPQFKTRLSPYLPADLGAWWESIREEYMSLGPREISKQFTDTGNSNPRANVRLSV